MTWRGSGIITAADQREAALLSDACWFKTQVSSLQFILTYWIPYYVTNRWEQFLCWSLCYKITKNTSRKAPRKDLRKVSRKRTFSTVKEILTEEKRNWGDEEGEEEANQHRDISEKNKPLWESQGQDLGTDSRGSVHTVDEDFRWERTETDAQGWRWPWLNDFSKSS